MKDAENFLSFTELKEGFGVKTNFLVYHGLVSCLKLLRTAIENQTEENRNFSIFVEDFTKASKFNRLVHKKLVSAKQSSPRKRQDNWSADCSLQCSKTIDYKLPFDSTKATKLIIFQFKLRHRRLATNDFLNTIGIRENDICTFCRTEKESLFHLFCSCSETSFFWQNQIKLKSNIFTPDIIIGLGRTPYPTQSSTFTFLLPDITYGPAK